MRGSLKFKNTSLPRLDKFAKQSPKAFKKALEKGALQQLTWMNTGSPAESAKPPIKWGVLRGSSSAFVGGTLVGVGPTKVNAASPEQATPLRTYNAKAFTITWGYNTDYATKMHEWKGGWGDATERDGDAGNKWVEKHLKADRNLLIKMIGAEFKKEMAL